MTATTTYGHWTTTVDSTTSTLEQAVLEFVSGADRDWISALKTTGALDRIIADYRDEINNSLPPGVVLTGSSEFIGPFEHDGWEGYPTTEDGDLDIAAIVRSVDLSAIVARHDPDKQGTGYTYAIETSSDGESWGVELVDSAPATESPDECANRLLTSWLQEFEEIPRYSRCAVWQGGGIGGIDQAAAIATPPPDYPVTVYWSIVRGPAPYAEAVEPGPLGVTVPDEVLELGARFGLDDDPDVYVLVTPAELAGEIPGELAYYRARMPYATALEVWAQIERKQQERR